MHVKYIQCAITVTTNREQEGMSDTYMCVYAYKYMHINMYMYMYANMYMYVYKCIHVYAY